MPRSRKQGRAQRMGQGQVIAVLSYLSFLCIIPLIFQKNNAFVVAHAKQGLVIFIAQVGVFVSHILFGTWVLNLGEAILSVVSIFGIVAVLRGHYVAFPVFARIADRISL